MPYVRHGGYHLPSMIVLRNFTAAFAWVLSALFLLGCATATYVLLRDGSYGLQVNPPEKTDVYPPWFLPALVLVFWCVGVAVAVHASRKPCVTVRLPQDRSVIVTTRFPFRVFVSSYVPRDISPAAVIESEDSEGQPYFRVEAGLPDGRRIDIAEGHSRPHCEATCERFNKALWPSGSQPPGNPRTPSLTPVTHASHSPHDHA